MLFFYIIFMLLSPWLLWNSILLYKITQLDTSFNYFIISKTQFWKYWLVISTTILLSIYIFTVRLRRTNWTINIYDMFETLKVILESLSWSSLSLAGIFGLMVTIFWILLLRCIFQYIRKCLLALYLYQHQFKYFRKFCVRVLCLHILYDLYLVRRVKIFTKSARIHAIARTIWPIGTNIIERNLFYFFIPYLTIFDILTQDGQISKIFIILPWFYIYTLIRSLYNLYFLLDTEENEDLSESFYGLR